MIEAVIHTSSATPRGVMVTFHETTGRDLVHNTARFGLAQRQVMHDWPMGPGGRDGTLSELYPHIMRALNDGWPLPVRPTRTKQG